MAWLLRTVAVLVGSLNAAAFAWISSSVMLLGDNVQGIPWVVTAVFVPVAGCMGFLVAEVLLRTLGFALHGALWTRSLTLFLGFGLGGVLTATSLVIISFIYALLGLITVSADAAGFALLALVLGGSYGFMEGLLLAVPLAALLGLSIR